MLNAVKFTVAPLSLAFFAYLSFTQRGVLTYSAFLYAYAMIPLIEFFLKNDERNLSEFEESLAKKNIAYDLAIIFFIPIILRTLVKLIFYRYIKKDINNNEKYYFRLLGIFSSILGKKSSLRIN